MVSASVRRLSETDRDALDRFLKQNIEETMFLRFNMYRGGLGHSGRPGESIFWGAFEASEIISVLSFAWNGYIQSFATCERELLARQLTEYMKSNDRCSPGINGVTQYTRPLIEQLQLSEVPRKMDSDEQLMSLDLKNLLPPVSIDMDGLMLRNPKESDAACLLKWQLAYEVEALGGVDDQKLRERVTKRIPGLIKRSGGFVKILTDNERPVCRTGFSAMLPDAVMVAAVFTPMEYRNRGYAKAAVYKSLQEMQTRGVKKAVLFTASLPAERAYRALGFRAAGQYSIVNFETPWQPS